MINSHIHKMLHDISAKKMTEEAEERMDDLVQKAELVPNRTRSRYVYNEGYRDAIKDVWAELLFRTKRK